MRRLVALLLIAILSTLPLAGMAKTTAADAQEQQEMLDMPCHQGAPKSDTATSDHCDSCASAGLCCATFLPPASLAKTVEQAGTARIAVAAGLAAGIVLPPLDPPPLAS
jgi:hypothetical protein